MLSQYAKYLTPNQIAIMFSFHFGISLMSRRLIAALASAHCDNQGSLGSGGHAQGCPGWRWLAVTTDIVRVHPPNRCSALGIGLWTTPGNGVSFVSALGHLRVEEV